jgi:hypothetical protein
MKIDLSTTDVANLLGAMNSVPIQGENQMIAALTLIQKLKRALQEEQDVQKREPADGGHPVNQEG